MASTPSSHRRPTLARPAGPVQRFLGWLRHRPLAVGVVVIAVLTLTASAYQNAQGRTHNPPPSASTPTFAGCVASDCTHDRDTATDHEGKQAQPDTWPTQSPAQNTPRTTPETPETADRGPGTSSRTWPLVKHGGQGQTVTAIQLLLSAHGYRTEADAFFGSGTLAQVTAFQRNHSLAPDGIVGPDTWHALIITVRTGDRGPAVEAMQRLLAAHGEPVTADGVFGQETAQAVAAFQTDQHLAADGIVGPDTWAALANLA